MATAAAAIKARARRQIQEHFFSADAVRADRTTSFEPENRVERRLFDHYRSIGIVHEEKPGQYWLDLPAYDRLLRERHRQARLIMLLLVIVTVALVLYGGFGGKQ